MKQIIVATIMGIAVLGAMPATAQNSSSASINSRQVALTQRIDAGVRNGTLAPGEAKSLRAQFDDIAALEAKFRAAGGLSTSEEKDIVQRINALSARIQNEKTDSRTVPGSPVASINARQVDLVKRVDNGVANGTLTPAEARRVRAELSEIERIEARYRASDGISASEQRDIFGRLNALSASVKTEKSDEQNRR